MVQSTLHRYFPTCRPARAAPKKTFLNLPFNIRHNVYLLAGLPVDSTIYLNYTPSSEEHCIQEYNPLDIEHWPTEPNIRPRSQSLSHFLDGYLPSPHIHLNRNCVCADYGSKVTRNASGSYKYNDCRCAPLPWQLLYVSKPIADEVSAIFYSSNHFSIFQDSLGGLSGLKSLPKQALAKMRSLSLCLNYFDPDPGRDFGPKSRDVPCHATCTASFQQQVFSNAKDHREFSSIDELEQLCHLLRTHIQPNQLRLSFTCDVADIEIAEQVLRPLSQLPHLRDCSIRLGFQHPPTNTEHVPLLQELAKAKVTYLIHPSNPKTFDFTALPPEIQLQILSYTQLVTPYDLIWGLNTPISTTIQSPFYEPRTFPYRSYPWVPECCGTCSHSHSRSNKPQICACWSKHAAFSSTCTCWRFPLSLFLVSKCVKEMAESLFYSRNHFWVLPRWWNASRKLEIWNFLTWVGEARSHLRSLTWEVSWNVKGEWGGYLQDGDETYEQWRATLEFLRAIPPGQLRLTIDSNFSQAEVYYANGGWEYGDSGVVVPESIYISEAKFTFSVAQVLAKGLIEHEVKLKDLFWHLPWPRIRESQGEAEIGLGSTEGEKRKIDQGSALEKMVMGPFYEGEERGKSERRQEWNGYRDHQPPY